jgi:hypothetical protein
VLLFEKKCFFLPCFSLIKLKKYNLGKWSKMMNKVDYFIFYEKNSAWLDINSIDDTATALLTVLLANFIGYFLLATCVVFTLFNI